MQPYLAPAESSTEFVSRWNEAARNLAEPDALRLFMTFSQHPRLTDATNQTSGPCGDPDDRFLHARLQGQTKGVFDVFFDSGAPEQVWAGQSKTVEGTTYYMSGLLFLCSRKTRTRRRPTASALKKAEAMRSTFCPTRFVSRSNRPPPSTRSQPWT